ncbi:dienelactone hydrolase family protein, partial [Streptomyces sp. DSM 41979]
MKEIRTRAVAYDADGLRMTGHLALPGGTGPRPAVLLGPEGPGLGDAERGRAEALAELGYVALAFDLHGGQYLGTPAHMLARCLPLLADPGRLRGIGHAALDVLTAEPRTDPARVAAIGYGTGGAVVLELGRDRGGQGVPAADEGRHVGGLRLRAAHHVVRGAHLGADDVPRA